MHGTSGQVVSEISKYTDIVNDSQQLLLWYSEVARPYLEQNARDHLVTLDNDADRLQRLLDRTDEVTVCFLGHSGIGKSTLLNAVAAGRDQVLPAGGIGPLTAQATEVHFSNVPSFKVEYHKKSHLWRIVFALERHHERSSGAQSVGVEPVSPIVVDEETKSELTEEIAASDGSEADSGGAVYVKQALQITAGDQFAQRSIEYLIDSLRVACGQESRWHSEISVDDMQRVTRVRGALEMSEKNRPFELRSSGDMQEVTRELKLHAAGFLAPLISNISVGWPSDLLEAGVRLVDLPGVGIARDAYRRVTKEFIREKARAVVLVVDRAGPTAETVDLLRTSGYWDRLVGAADDPNSDPCKLIIAVTKVDDVASEEWRNTEDLPGKPRPKKRVVYAALVEEFKLRMKSQISDQLGTIGTTGNAAVTQARATAREQILSTLEVHPISAPEYRKFLLDNEDERAFLRSEEESGVPALRESLKNLAKAERHARHVGLTDVYDRFRQGVDGELMRLDALWREQTRAADEAARLEAELDVAIAPKRKERDLRVGAFREFLDATATTRIRELVLEARQVAEEEVAHYLSGLRGTHWATLRAAVRRGGAFVGTRAVNLPDDIAGMFQEPMAAVWGQKLLKDVKSRTQQFAKDQCSLVEELCTWAEEHTEEATARLISGQRKRIERRAAQMQDVGKEAVTDLRKVVKQTLSDAIDKPIRLACDRFVKEGDDIGPGVKNRIIGLFQELAAKATRAAQEPAARILQENFSVVRNEIRSAFEDWGDPLQETADLIVQRHLKNASRKDAERRDAMLKAIEGVLSKQPKDKALVR